MHDSDILCEGTLKVYSPEDSLAKEQVPLTACRQMNKPDQELTGISSSKYEYLEAGHWYNLCERQSLQYGPKFQRVHKYAVDRSWCELK